MLSRESYFHPDVLKKEEEAVFKSQWLFACLTSEVPNRHDYKVIEYFKHSIIIFNTGNEIKIFQNVCPHRFNRLFSDEYGNSHLHCKYHAWSFGDDGKCLSKLDIYSNQETEKPCLKTYQSTIIGKFIFFSFQALPHSLADQLGEEMMNTLIHFSDRLDSSIHSQKVLHACNWKFIVENVIEVQHCIAIHKDTLVKAGYCKVSPTQIHDNLKSNSSFIVPFANQNFEKKRSFIVNHLFGKDNVKANYTHHFIFPNLLLSDFENINFNVARLIPLSADATDFDMQFFIAASKSENIELLEEYVRMTKEFGIKVFEEDKAQLENLQKGVMEVDHDGFHYHAAERITWFNEAYKFWMNKYGTTNN
jgi:phenylpropionate dioxygenase-like ring-hydroxylating dioxygenase large terminal subunit